MELEIESDGLKDQVFILHEARGYTDFAGVKKPVKTVSSSAIASRAHSEVYRLCNFQNQLRI
jgi:hypothetical protein